MSKQAVIKGSCENCYLRKSPRSIALGPREHQLISRSLVRRFVVEEGEQLVETGQASGVYTLYDGSAFEAITLPDGRRQIVDFYIPGDIIGFDGIAGRAQRSVTMMSSAIICEFVPDMLDLLIEADAAFARNLIAAALEKARSLEDLAVRLGRMRAIERVADLFLTIYTRSAAINRVSYGGSITCAFPATHRILADATGLTPAHINNILRELREGRIAVLSGKILTIHDLPQLEQLAGTAAVELGQRLIL